MSPISSRWTDVVLRLVRSTPDEAERSGIRAASPSSENTAVTDYAVLIYSNVALPTSISPGYPTALAELPLAGVERVQIGWSSYHDYLADFVSGEKAPEAMRSRLLRTLSPNLALIISQLSQQPLTRLWLFSESPELDELPWELLLGDSTNEAQTETSIVRGLPSRQPRPLVQLQGKPRLALIGAPPLAPPALWNRLNSLQSVEVTPLSGDPRLALRQATAESFELIHLVADGFVTQAYEAALYFHGVGESEPAARALTVSELGFEFLGSRVAALGLSVPDYHNPDVMTLAGREVPSAYRAFARFGVIEPSLPTILAPLGPLDAAIPVGVSRLADFWGEFYEGVGESCDVLEAMRRARRRVRAAPMALFLRHPSGRLFRRPGAAPPQVTAPLPHKAAEYALSLRMTDRFRTLREGLGDFSKNVTDFLEKERSHQQEIANELESWNRSEEQSE